MKLTLELVERLCEKHHRPIDRIAFEYGEPGYETDKEAILFGNWNDIPSYLINVLEKQYELEWEDEWILSESGKAYRCSPDCYSWTQYYVILNECEVFGIDEIEEDDSLIEAYLSTLINNHTNCCLLDNSTLENVGFKNMNGEFEYGFYDINDDPKTILSEFKEKFPNHDFIFGNLSSEQFRINFEIWGREKINQ